eukprot:gene2153-2190_t
MITRAVVATLLALTSVQAAAQGLPQLRVAIPQDADSLDPTIGRASVQRVALLNMCDTLFTYNEKLELVPRLATGYEWADSRTLVVKLRPNVTFQDGTPVDAAAVKYNMERNANLPTSARKSDVGSLDHVEIIDPLTVRFVTKTPDVVFLSQLAIRASMLVSPKAAEAAGKDFALHPICAGPYKFVERVAQDRIVLDRVPDYWDAANYHFSRVTFRPMTDGSVRLANLQAGAIDVDMGTSPIDAERVRQDKRLKLLSFDGLGYSGITINLGRSAPGQTALGTDPRVRRAFELSIDREALVQTVYAGAHAITSQPVSPSSPFYDSAMPPSKRDIAQAKRLLAEAGVKLPLQITLTIINQPDSVQAGEVIQAMAAEAGFDVRLNAMEFASSLDTVYAGNFTAYLIGWTGRPDADGNVRDLLYTDAPQNAPGYRNKTFDSLLDQARATSDMSQRRLLYAKIFDQLHQDLPIVYLYAPRWLFSTTAKLNGFVPVADGMLRLNGVTLQ